MITQYPLDSTAWVAISAAGQGGSCWLDEDNDGAGGRVEVRLYHSDAGVPALAKATEGKQVYKPMGNKDTLPFTADNASDVYYAICVNPGDTAIISSDVV